MIAWCVGGDVAAAAIAAVTVIGVELVRLARDRALRGRGRRRTRAGDQGSANGSECRG
jgi:hypothetical protein